MQCSGTIGVFDSGVGGLSVLRHIRQVLPDERLIYVADSGHVPYGDKSPEYIGQRSLAIAEFLIEQRADAIVIACNTATAAAANLLRSRFDIPIVGMEPAIKPAVAATRNGVVGVLATTGTLESARFAALLEYKGTLVFVSHDREFVSSLATRIIEISAKGVNDYHGTYEEFLRDQMVA